MKQYLKSIIPTIKNFSQSLDKTSLLVEKPWVLIDDNQDTQKLIFKKNKELVLSINGQVTIGKWDYLAEAKCLLIDRGTDKILCNQGYLDDGILILKLDSVLDQYFILANQNIIPNVKNVFQYILEIRRKYLNLRTMTLANGQTLEAIPKTNWSIYPEIGDAVSIDFELVPDGDYFVMKEDFLEFSLKYVIRESKIIDKKYYVKYKSKDGLILVIEQKDPYVNCKIGDKVSLEHGEIQDKKYKLKGYRNIIVRNGVIFDKTFF